jgi:glycosyltransferase involved in cell wall biosynthesis
MLSVHRTLGTFRNKVDRYIALNQFCRSKFIEGGLPGERIDVKPNFVDVQLAQSSGPRSSGLYVGRLSKEKGLDVLLQALDLVPALSVDVIGTGPEAATLAKHSRVRLMGWQPREEVHARMARAAYLIVPSIWYETFGLVAVEAFACGLPVIASRLGALNELIRDRETGLLFEPGSAEGLAEAVQWADANPGELRSIADSARAEYEEKYTEAVNYEQLMSVYERARETARSH